MLGRPLDRESSVSTTRRWPRDHGGRVRPRQRKVLGQGLYKEDWTFNLQLGDGLEHRGDVGAELHHVVYQECKPGNISAGRRLRRPDRLDLLREETPDRSARSSGAASKMKARWEYPRPRDFPTSPAFAPHVGCDPAASRYAGRSPGGHDATSSSRAERRRTAQVGLFDAARVGDGPVATLRARRGHPAGSPLGVVACQPPPVDAERLRFTDGGPEAPRRSPRSCTRRSTRSPPSSLLLLSALRLRCCATLSLRTAQRVQGLTALAGAPTRTIRRRDVRLALASSPEAGFWLEKAGGNVPRGDGDHFAESGCSSASSCPATRCCSSAASSPRQMPTSSSPPPARRCSPGRRRLHHCW